MTQEILAAARAHLARDGAAALSLRSIARELEMAPSALYRYFSGRDALLSALILGAYESLADRAEAASNAAYAHAGSDGERWLAVPRAMRQWALEHSHEWGLIFGAPVPGYEAPEDTVVPYTRLAAAVVRPIAEAAGAGRLAAPGPALSSPDLSSPAMAAALAPVAEALLPGAATATVTLLMQTWCTLIGVISLEVFGHWRRTVLDPALFFDATVRQAGWTVGLDPQPAP